MLVRTSCVYNYLVTMSVNFHRIQGHAECSRDAVESKVFFFMQIILTSNTLDMCFWDHYSACVEVT